MNFRPESVSVDISCKKKHLIEDSDHDEESQESESGSEKEGSNEDLDILTLKITN